MTATAAKEFVPERIQSEAKSFDWRPGVKKSSKQAKNKQTNKKTSRTDQDSAENSKEKDLQGYYLWWIPHSVGL